MIERPLDIAAIQAFVRIGELGSFTRAAEVMQTTQAAISLKLKRLEDRLDAKVPEGNPGSIFAVPGNVLAKPPNASFNLHDFRWDHALHAGKQIYKDEFPEQIKVFLIEAQSLELGIGLSAPVTKAVDTVALQISEIAKTFVADREFSS